MQDAINIVYNIKFNDDVTEFNFKLDGSNFELITSDVEDLPKWTRLEHNKCSHCPLSEEKHPHCPLAVQLHSVVERFHDTRSIDVVEVEVITEERKVIQTTAIQRVIASMLGLIFPTCGCPKTAYMRPMARFHLPLASEEETVFRVTGMYLLAQYFLSITNRTGRIEFDGLTEIYEDLHILNTAIAGRIKHATSSDSSKNAVTLLDMYSTLVPMLLEDQLVEMRCFFEAYLPEDALDTGSSNLLEKAKAFTLELVPIEGDNSAPGWLDGEPSGKAVYSLPDDDEPAVIQSKHSGKATFTLPGDEQNPPVQADSDSGGLSLQLEEVEEKPKIAGKATFALPDEEPLPGSTEQKETEKASFSLADEDDNSDGGLKTLDFEP